MFLPQFTPKSTSQSSVNSGICAIHIPMETQKTNFSQSRSSNYTVLQHPMGNLSQTHQLYKGLVSAVAYTYRPGYTAVLFSEN